MAGWGLLRLGGCGVFRLLLGFRVAWLRIETVLTGLYICFSWFRRSTFKFTY